MQTSEHIIAYQTVSSSAYLRLRETLLQQASSFEAAEQGTDFVLLRSAELSVLLTVVELSESKRAGQGNARLANASPENDACTYRVGLTFDDQAIAVFTDRAKARQASTHQSRPHPGLHHSKAHHSKAHRSSPHHSRADYRAHLAPSALSSVKENKIMAQKSFVLAWAKDLASSPEGDTQSDVYSTQTALDNQLQQGLLLDQVITRIRHSLDLPAILETTVAQVREFLSADRLVLYQFDRFDSAKDSATHSASDNAVTASTSAGQHPRRSPLDPPVVGRFAHDGHVTYESRMSDNISSVLHLSEKECFSPAHSQRYDRYLLGEPIAVDDIDEAYQDVQCLLNFLHQASVKSKIIAPIIVQDSLWGLLIAHQCQHYRHWEDSEAIFLQHIAEHLAVAISQASLYQQLLQQTMSLESCVIERTQSLQDALIAAESANITKGEFLSTMSHELRTPLTYIIGMSATLMRWSLGELNERQRSYLKTINQSGEQLLTVINNILEFASVESGRSLLNAAPLLLGDFMPKVVAAHQPIAKAQEVTLSLSVGVEPGQDLMEADAKRLQQIIDNLVDNAIKFTGAGGSVTVRVWREQQSVVLEVKDTGVGIPTSQIGELFEKFKQLERPFQRQYSGTGLGLAMTKRLVEMHGGTIQVRSKVAQGSVFTVRLPVHSEPVGAPAKQPQSLEKALETSPNRVILLEKDEDNAAIACEMLTAAGYEIIWIVESHQLADQLGTLKPALLIADLSLLNPDLSYIKTIQHTITALNTKVLAISAEQSFNHATMAHHDILSKPLEPKALLSKVKQLL